QRARPARDGLSAARVASSAADSARRNAQLQRGGARDGRAECDTRGCPRLRDESSCADRSLPSGGGRRWVAHGTPVGRGTEARPAGGGERQFADFSSQFLVRSALFEFKVLHPCLKFGRSIDENAGGVGASWICLRRLRCYSARH